MHALQLRQICNGLFNCLQVLKASLWKPMSLATTLRLPPAKRIISGQTMLQFAWQFFFLRNRHTPSTTLLPTVCSYSFVFFVQQWVELNVIVLNQQNKGFALVGTSFSPCVASNCGYLDFGLCCLCSLRDLGACLAVCTGPKRTDLRCCHSELRRCAEWEKLSIAAATYSPMDLKQVWMYNDV